MKTKVATAIAEGQPMEAATSLVADVRSRLAGELPTLVLVFSSTKQPLASLVPVLAEEFKGSTILGCSSAGEFIQSGDKEGATAIFAVIGDFKVFAGIGTGVRADVENAVVKVVSELPTSIDGYPYCTAILLLDGYCGMGEEVTLIAASMLGESVRLAGGAAGDDLQMKATYVACNGAVASDGVVIAKIFSKAPLGVGVAHGHVPLAGPLQVTRAEGNVVYEIDGRPAWEVWVEKTREKAAARGVNPERLSGGDLMQFLGEHEGGLEVGEEYKVRFPMARGPDASLIFATGIAEGAILHVMQSDGERQIQSARLAVRRALDQLGGRRPAGAVVFDCRCRKDSLGPEFKRAVETIAQELQAPIAGFEAYGEVAMNIGDLSGFHNTTTVVLAFPE